MLKESAFEFDEETSKQVRGTAIRTKFAPGYANLFMTDLNEKLSMFLRRYIDNIFLSGNKEKNLWKNFAIN